jgi:hypothetical protein
MARLPLPEALELVLLHQLVTNGEHWVIIRLLQHRLVQAGAVYPVAWDHLFRGVEQEGVWLAAEQVVAEDQTLPVEI